MSIVESLRQLFLSPPQKRAPVGSLARKGVDAHTRAAARDADQRDLSNADGVANRLINRLVPTHCVLCADTCTQVVCAPCERALKRVPDESCPRCKLPSSHAQVCGRCLRYPPKWERLSATFTYEFPLDRVIVGAKHGRHWGTFDWAASVYETLPLETNTILIPVPASPERLTERGYNQATLLAQSLAKRFALRVDNDAIIRIRETGSQANRNWVERRKNVKHAFAATRSMVGESVVLVDDVLTTGATLNECARAALGAGAAKVDALVIARVNPPSARSRIQKFNRAAA